MGNGKRRKKQTKSLLFKHGWSKGFAFLHWLRCAGFALVFGVVDLLKHPRAERRAVELLARGTPAQTLLPIDAAECDVVRCAAVVVIFLCTVAHGLLPRTRRGCLQRRCRDDEALALLRPDECMRIVVQDVVQTAHAPVADKVGKLVVRWNHKLCFTHQRSAQDREMKKREQTEKRRLMQLSWNQSSQAAHWTILALCTGSYERSHQQKRPM